MRHGKTHVTRQPVKYDLEKNVGEFSTKRPPLNIPNISFKSPISVRCNLLDTTLCRSVKINPLSSGRCEGSQQVKEM